MKVWHKILVAPAVAIVFLLALGAATYSVLHRQHAALAELFEQRIANYRLVAQSAEQLSAAHARAYRLLGLIGSMDEAGIKRASDALLSSVDEVTKKVSAFAARQDMDEAERGVARTAAERLPKYRKHVALAIDLSAGDVNTGVAAMQTADLGYLDLANDFGQLVEFETRLAQDGYDAAAVAYNRMIVGLLAIIALALAASIGIALLMSRRIVRPLENAIAIAGRIAGGDLTSEVKVAGRDETAELLGALRDMNASLKRIVGEVRGSTDLVATASREIAQGNTDLSARTEQQASALEETSASMQQMTATVGQNAQNAKKANELAAQATGIAAKGGEVVKEAVGTMNDITASSRKIADIIGVIDGIAFQTNILALNAAVEAARAGEQGRGFAVVASEVRSLAQRSAAAAKEIKDLITDSVGKVDAGSRQVNDAGRTMQEIVASVKQVSGLIAEIAAASQEQAQGIEQVSETMTQLEKVTQQNAAMVEQASAAAGSLEQQSGALSSAVAEFKLGEQARSAPAAAPEAAKLVAAPAPPRLALGTKKEARKPQLQAPAAKPAARKEKELPAREEGWQEF